MSAMSKLLTSSLACVLALAAACGDDSTPSPHTPTPDAPVVTVDAAPADARICETDGYPRAIRMLSVDLEAPRTLTLDGTGTRCEQIVRALTDPDPTQRPAELAQLDVDGVTSTCTRDVELDREVVRLYAPNLGGLPLFAPLQEVIVHVGAPAEIVYLHGDFFPAGDPAIAPACLDEGQIAGSIPGREVTYSRYQACTFQGDGTYTFAADDVIDVGDEGYIVDAESRLRRVRAVDAYLRAANLTDDTINSDLYCCSGQSQERCVGRRLFVDALTGELVSTAPHCHTC